MNRFIKAILCLALVIALLIGEFNLSTVYSDDILSEEQKNAIAILNYITVLTQDINSSNNNQLRLNEAYSTLYENIDMAAIDLETKNQITTLMDIMFHYQMIESNKELLKSIYNQRRAQLLRRVVGKLLIKASDALGSIAFAETIDFEQLAKETITADGDLIDDSLKELEKAELEYLIGGWSLDQEVENKLHETRKDALDYMFQMIKTYDLPSDLVLTEKDVDELVEWKNNPNIAGRVQFLESNKKRYQLYSGFWLILAEAHYLNGDYKQCLEAVDTYESMQTRLFKRDYEYARILPLAIGAAKQSYKPEQYVRYALDHALAIEDIVDEDDWEYKYFVEITLMDLYIQTGAEVHLREALRIARENINSLVKTQRALNAQFVSEVREESIPSDASQSQKREIKKYNKALKEIRKTELPPVYEPLLLNCDLVFLIADKLDISKKEKEEIDSLLHVNGESLFLNESIDDIYWLTAPKSSKAADTVGVDFKGTDMNIPAELLTNEADITVKLKDSSKTVLRVDDWKISKTVREQEGDISTYIAEYKSDSLENYNWNPGMDIIIEIKPIENLDYKKTYTFRTVVAKENWYDYFKVWEGHKNHWYDYLKVWEEGVKFVRTS